MSETLDRLRGLQYVPIFPLPLVLMPNEMLPLHIFEDRYRKMLDDVTEEDGYFGVSLFEPSTSLVEVPPVGSVGCLAQVRTVEKLADGRSNIITFGVLRYRLLNYADNGEPYLVGEIETFEDEIEGPEEGDLQSITREVLELFGRMASAAMVLSGKTGSVPEMPFVDPEPLSFLVAAAFNFDNHRKYQLLETTSTSDRLRDLTQLLIPTVRQMEESAAILKSAQGNGRASRPDLN